MLMPVADELPAGNDPRLDDILTLADAATYLKASEDALLQLAKDGMIPAQKIGVEWRFLRKALNDWLRYGMMHPYRKVWPLNPEFFLESPFVEELLSLLEQRLLYKLKAEAIPKAGSKEAVKQHFGIWRDDPTAEAMLEDIYKRRAEGDE
jgi:excisionase family DNA binding protein